MWENKNASRCGKRGKTTATDDDHQVETALNCEKFCSPLKNGGLFLLT